VPIHIAAAAAFAVRALGFGQGAHHPLRQDLVQSVETSRRVVRAARAHEIDQAFAWYIAGIIAATNLNAGQEIIPRQAFQLDQLGFDLRNARIEFLRAEPLFSEWRYQLPLHPSCRTDPMRCPTSPSIIARIPFRDRPAALRAWRPEAWPDYRLSIEPPAACRLPARPEAPNPVRLP